MGMNSRRIKEIFKDIFKCKHNANRLYVEKDQTIKDMATAWIFAIKTEDSYETATVILNKLFITYMYDRGISFSLSTLISYNGRACLIYAKLQGYKHKNRYGKYVYWDTIPNLPLVEAGDLVESEPKEQRRQIQKAFTEIGLEYTYNANTDNWIKVRYKDRKPK